MGLLLHSIGITVSQCHTVALTSIVLFKYNLIASITCRHVIADATYFVSADEVEWNYAPPGPNLCIKTEDKSHSSPSHANSEAATITTVFKNSLDIPVNMVSHGGLIPLSPPSPSSP